MSLVNLKNAYLRRGLLVVAAAFVPVGLVVVAAVAAADAVREVVGDLPRAFREAWRGRD